jgi:hypothetical protein
MRILFTFAHFYNAQGGGAYGSLKADPRPRMAALASAIFALHSTFGRRQGLLLKPVAASNTTHCADIDVVVCTTGPNHLLNQLRLPAGLYRHHATQASPMFLGFECHAVLRDNLGKFDYYCFLEDDILINDPLFFDKLRWFNTLFGDGAVLQPNRFEVAVGQQVHKLYVDGDLRDRSISERLQDVTDCPVLEAEAFGKKLVFRRVNNPHSGCFFLNARQMQHWVEQPEFLNRDPSFAGPLESAATLGIMHFFRAYKPARENAGFLEVRHLDNRYLGARGKPAPRAAAQAQK